MADPLEDSRQPEENSSASGAWIQGEGHRVAEYVQNGARRSGKRGRERLK